MADVKHANLFELHGERAHVVYASSRVDGKPHLTYQDTAQTQEFSGDDIRSVETDLGTIVSVTIRKTVDTGSTSFSLLVPTTNLDAVSSTHLFTEGITTIHRFSVVPSLNNGQLDSYTVTRLSGTASLVEF